MRRPARSRERAQPCLDGALRQRCSCDLALGAILAFLGARSVGDLAARRAGRTFRTAAPAGNAARRAHPKHQPGRDDQHGPGRVTGWAPGRLYEMHCAGGLGLNYSAPFRLHHQRTLNAGSACRGAEGGGAKSVASAGWVAAPAQINRRCGRPSLFALLTELPELPQASARGARRRKFPQTVYPTARLSLGNFTCNDGSGRARSTTSSCGSKACTTGAEDEGPSCTTSGSLGDARDLPELGSAAAPRAPPAVHQHSRARARRELFVANSRLRERRHGSIRSEIDRIDPAGCPVVADRAPSLAITDNAMLRPPAGSC